MRRTTLRAAALAWAAAAALAASVAGCRASDARDAAKADEGATTTGAAPRAPARRPERLGVGRAATRAEIAAWDRDVDAAGHGLPPGRGTPAAGERLYATRCAACHGARGEGVGPFPRLVQRAAADPATGDAFPFDRDPSVPKTVGNYWPYATTLFDYVRHAMPYDRPGSLTADETYALVAYLLAENGVVTRTAVMDARTLPKVELPGRRHFVPDDRKGGPEVR